MSNLAFNIWLIFGLVCIISELLLPGLVLVFIGLGSLTVALCMYLGAIVAIEYQLILFFASSLVYLLILRTIVVSFLPNETAKANIDEDQMMIGEIVEVVENINGTHAGRILYGESTWSAKSQKGGDFFKGDRVKVTGRDNITYLVEKI